MIPVEIAFKAEAVQRPFLRPKRELKGPMASEPTKVPTVMSDDISCWTVVSMAHFWADSSKYPKTRRKPGMAMKPPTRA